MKQTTLLKLALICSLLGIVILFIISEIIPPSRFSGTQDFKKTELNSYIKTTGTVAKVTEKETVLFIELIPQETVTIVAFKKNKNSPAANISQGETIEIIGTTQEYNGKKEIIAQRIRKIN